MGQVEIIAEVGECFNGKMESAYAMIRAAAEAGCDIVKFQLLDMAEVATDDPEYDWFASLELDPGRIQSLIDCAESAGLDILFTPVSVKTAGWLHEAGLSKVKIASSFIRKRELLDYINKHFRQVYISTGMAGLDEIVEAVRLLEKPEDLAIMHCISEYPTGPLLEQRGLCAMREEDAHLEMMHILQELFPECRVGYSDHTDGIFVPLLAVAMGAAVIEKHITLDRQTPMKHFANNLDYMGTDHVLSIEPPQLCKMVAEIRRAEKIMGLHVWQRTEGEQILKDFLRGRYQEGREV